MPKLTKAVVEAITPPARGHIIVWDSALPGFGVRVSAAGARTFFLQRRVNGRAVKRTVGRYGVLTAEQARKDATATAGELTRGVDAYAERKRATAEREAAEARQVSLEVAKVTYLASRPLKPRTVRDVEAVMLRDFADWLALPVAQITAEMVDERYAKLTTGKATGAAAKLSFRYLRAILNFADAKFSVAGQPLLQRNPVNRLSVTHKGWTGGRRRRSFVRPSQLRPWVAAVQGLKGPLMAEARDCLMLALLTGVRPSEALGLRWADVDVANQALGFRDTKNGSDHELPLTDWVAAMLGARREISTGLLVFTDAGGRPLTYSALRSAVAEVAEATGLPFMASDLRRTFVTTAEQLDIGVYSLKHMLNHTINGDVTAGYVVAVTERIREPMQRVEDFMLSAAGLRPTAEVIAFRQEA